MVSWTRLAELEIWFYAILIISWKINATWEHKRKFHRKAMPNESVIDTKNLKKQHAYKFYDSSIKMPCAVKFLCFKRKGTENSILSNYFMSVHIANPRCSFCNLASKAITSSNASKAITSSEFGWMIIKSVLASYNKSHLSQLRQAPCFLWPGQAFFYDMFMDLPSIWTWCELAATNARRQLP